jgi:hypothetical protein
MKEQSDTISATGALERTSLTERISRHMLYKEARMANRIVVIRGACAVALLLVLTSVAAHPVRAAADSPAFPSNPFFAAMTITSGQKKAVGPDAGTLGVTSLTISNFNNSTQQLFIFAPVIKGTNCNGTISGGGSPTLHLLLEPNKTVHLTFPTPLVFAKIGSVSCIAAEVTTVQAASVIIEVNGFSQ